MSFVCWIPPLPSTTFYPSTLLPASSHLHLQLPKHILQIIQFLHRPALPPLHNLLLSNSESSKSSNEKIILDIDRASSLINSSASPSLLTLRHLDLRHMHLMTVSIGLVDMGRGVRTRIGGSFGGAGGGMPPSGVRHRRVDRADGCIAGGFLSESRTRTGTGGGGGGVAGAAGGVLDVVAGVTLRVLASTTLTVLTLTLTVLTLTLTVLVGGLALRITTLLRGISVTSLGGGLIGLSGLIYTVPSLMDGVLVVLVPGIVTLISLGRILVVVSVSIVTTGVLIPRHLGGYLVLESPV